MLTDTKIRKAKDRVYTLADGNGLALEINLKGGKYWRMRCTIDGKRKLFALGVYPSVSLLNARERRDEYKKQTGKVQRNG